MISVTVVTTGCLEEKFPSQVQTSDQLGSSPDALQFLANGMYSYLHVDNCGGGADEVAWGYGARMMSHSMMGPDVTLGSSSLNYAGRPFGDLLYLGNWGYQSTDWYYYYRQIFTSNQVLQAVNVDDPELATALKEVAGQALILRAWMYLDMAVTYEYKKTGYDALDQKATDNGIMGLTVPIVSERTSEAESFSNPRAPYYAMYRFILTDLNKAENFLSTYTRADKATPDLSVVYGVQARFWLELATRFRLYPNDLTEMLSHDSDEALAYYDVLGVSTVQECYAKASDYARKAISYGGYSPLTSAQWHNATTGFNDASTSDAWMMAIVITEDAAPYYYYYSWVAQNSVEFNYSLYAPGFGNSETGYIRINKELYDQIPETDWRKTTWLDPADVGSAPGSKYVTLLSDDAFKKVIAYTGFKFRPGQGDMSNDKTGNAVDIPMMRVEEMYLIEAEAEAFANGLSAGVTLLNNFVSTYRNPAYSYTAADERDFLREILLQKRIEFWSEGNPGSLDFKRLEFRVERGYPGTNWLVSQRYNSSEKAGTVAPWMNLYITDNETTRNTAVIPNPDPSSVVSTECKWTE
jgi:hypothetical protein